jgi:hypothetical protein
MGPADCEKFPFWAALVRRELAVNELSRRLQMDVAILRAWCATDVTARHRSVVYSVLDRRPVRHYEDCRIPVQERFVIAVSDDDGADNVNTRRRRWHEKPDCGLDYAVACNFRAMGYGTTWQARNPLGQFELIFRFLPGHASGAIVGR